MIEHNSVLHRIIVTLNAHRRRLLVPLRHKIKSVRLPQIKITAKKYLWHCTEGRQSFRRHICWCVVRADQRMLALVPVPLAGELCDIVVQDPHVGRRHGWWCMSRRPDGREPGRARVNGCSPLPRVVEHCRNRMQSRERERCIIVSRGQVRIGSGVVPTLCLGRRRCHRAVTCHQYRFVAAKKGSLASPIAVDTEKSASCTRS